MSILPAKRKAPRRVADSNERVFQTHRAFVRGHDCSVLGCKAGPIEFAHLRTAANSGMGLKPPDWFGVSLCQDHHRRAHDAGHETMARENGMTLDRLFQIAAEFARQTTDKHMKEAMSAAGVGVHAHGRN